MFKFIKKLFSKKEVPVVAPSKPKPTHCNIHSRYIEYPFKHNAKRYVFSYNPKEQPANYITYFFTLALNNGSVYATPVDSSGMVTPITKYLLNPAEYYKKRSEIKN